jgi:hypothetical protein
MYAPHFAPSQPPCRRHSEYGTPAEQRDEYRQTQLGRLLQALVVVQVSAMPICGVWHWGVYSARVLLLKASESNKEERKGRECWNTRRSESKEPEQRGIAGVAC